MSVTFSDLFKFDRFFTPVLIKVIYIVWIIGGGLYLLFNIITLLTTMNGYGEYSEYMDPQILQMGVTVGIIGSIIGYLFGILIIRILLEGMIVIFNIYGNLRSMKETLSSATAGTESGLM